MSRFRAVLCAALIAVPAAGATPDPKDLAVPPEDLSKARELVRRMGGESYRDREEAQAELAKMGRRARRALAEAATSEADPEVRSRAIRLLPQAEADDLKARIDTFLEDKDGKFDHNLPGLKMFRKALGATPKARELYVEILKTPYNLDMFAAMDRGNVEGGRAVSDRRNMLYSSMIQRPGLGGGSRGPSKPLTLADIAAVLLAETEIPNEFIPRTTIQWMPVSGVVLLNQSASMTTLNGSGPHVEAYKVIMGRWLATRSDPADLTQIVHQLGSSHMQQFPETVSLLRRIVVLDGVQPYAKGQALTFLTQKRGKDEIPFLRALVRNEVRVGDYPEAFKKGENPDKVLPIGADAMITQAWFQRNQNGAPEMHAVTVRDVAFAFLITQSGLSMKDYGFETPPMQNFNLTPNLFGQYAFTSEEKRQAAFVKFGWYQMKDSIKKRGILLPHVRDR